MITLGDGEGEGEGELEEGEFGGDVLSEGMFVCSSPVEASDGSASVGITLK